MVLMGLVVQEAEARFGGGARYLDPAAAAARAEDEKVIRQMEHDEYTYKEDFKGLDEGEALKRGQEAQKIAAEKPGEALEIQLEDAATTAQMKGKREAMQARMKAKMEARQKARTARKRLPEEW